MKKKLISLALATVMTVTLLSGCGNKTDHSSTSTDTTKTDTSQETETTDTAQEPVTIKVAGWSMEANKNYAPKLVEEFEKKNSNIKVELIDIPSDDYTNKLSIMLNGASELDAFWIKDADTTPVLAERGQLMDFTEYVKRDNVDLSVYNGATDSFTIDGKLLGMPSQSAYYVLFYNKDIFDAAGVPYPTNDMTWTQFEELAGKLTSGEGANKKYGSYIHTWQACVQNWAVQDGKNDILATDYTFMKPYYEMALRLQDSGFSMDYSTLTTGSIHYSGPFQQGQIAMMPMGNWYCGVLITALNSGETDVNWGVATLPHPEGIEAGYTVGAVTPMAVNENSKKKEAAWEFAKYVSSKEAAVITAKAGIYPAILDDETSQVITELDGMPENSAEALAVKNIVLDRPLNIKTAEIDQMLGEEHSLIMIKELSIDEGLKEMSERSKEIQGK